jgi:phage portal protein BeeE
MNFLQMINQRFEVKGTQNTRGMTVYAKPLPAVFDPTQRLGNEVSFYATKNGQNIIQYGYNLNYVVHTCINIIQKVFGKVPFYVVNIKKGEQKAYWEGQELIKSGIKDIRAVSEWRRIQKKTIDGIIEDNRLAEKLNKPNRNQSGVAYREMLIAYKKLTGEGSQWLNRGVDDDGTQSTTGSVLEMFSIPKHVVQLVSNTVDPFEIVKYKIDLAGRTVDVPKENLLMWNESNLTFDPLTLAHLRGMSPLESAILQIQALNDAAQREITESQNGGANGLLFRKDAKELPTNPNTIASIRQQINQAVNGEDVAGTIAWLAGEWGYLPFGRSAQELQRVQLSEKNADAICNVLGVPPGLIKSDQTYTNAPAYWKQLVYGVIAPEAYSLRDVYNDENFMEMFGLDRDRYAVDCDVMALPELSEDLKTQIDAVLNADFLTLDEKRIATGYEPLGTPEAAKIYMGSSKTTLDDLNAPVGGNLDEEMNLLNP